jgi:alpha-tubulin suppressor-like RCC1 family protein
MRAPRRVLALVAINAAACGALAACNSLTGVGDFQIVDCFDCSDASDGASSPVDGASEASADAAGDSISPNDAPADEDARDSSLVDASEASIADATDAADATPSEAGSLDASDASDAGLAEAAAPEAGPDAGGPDAAGPCVGPPDGGSAVVVSLGLGDQHTCVALTDGTVHCWGDNSFGELGTGEDVVPFYLTATTAVGVQHAGAVSADGRHTCAIVDAGVWCWGDDYYGELGYDAGTTTCAGAPCSPLPTPIQGIPAAPSSLGLAQSTYALLGSTLYSWGVTPFPSPVPGPALTAYTDAGLPFATIDEIAVAGDHACARSGDQIACWGDNTYGQLGRGSTSGTSPGLVNVSGVVHVCSGDAFSCFTAVDGGVSCFGFDYHGELGSVGPDLCGSFPCSTTPTPVNLPIFATNVACGDGFACALSTDGTVECWGYDGDGETGIGGSGGQSLAPAQINSFACVMQLAVHGTHACALRTDGSLWCWGDNANGQLGDGTQNASFSPERIEY